MTAPLRDEVIDLLRREARRLHDRGVVHLALIGSLARGEARADSDVDVLIDIDPGRRFSLIDRSELRLFLCNLLDRDSDVLIRDALDSRSLSRVQQDDDRVLTIERRVRDRLEHRYHPGLHVHAKIFPIEVLRNHPSVYAEIFHCNV